MGQHAVQQQQPDVAQDNAADQVRHKEHRAEQRGALDRLGQHIGDGESDHVDHDGGHDGECSGETQCVQEFLVLQRLSVVLEPYPFAIGDGGEFAEAQVDAHDEGHQKPDDECGKRG